MPRALSSARNFRRSYFDAVKDHWLKARTASTDRQLKVGAENRPHASRHCIRWQQTTRLERIGALPATVRLAVMLNNDGQCRRLGFALENGAKEGNVCI